MTLKRTLRIAKEVASSLESVSLEHQQTTILRQKNVAYNTCRVCQLKDEQADDVPRPQSPHPTADWAPCLLGPTKRAVSRNAFATSFHKKLGFRFGSLRQRFLFENGKEGGAAYVKPVV
jgi:hypothetical protein